MSNLIDRVAVVAKAVPTYLVAAAIIVPIIAEEVAEELSGDTATKVVRIGAKVAGWLGAAVAIIRRSTPVIHSQRGLLKPPDGQPIIPAANMPGGPPPHEG